jgi:hypothetical protein
VNAKSTLAVRRLDEMTSATAAIVTVIAADRLQHSMCFVPPCSSHGGTIVLRLT